MVIWELTLDTSILVSFPNVTPIDLLTLYRSHDCTLGHDLYLGSRDRASVTGTNR